MSVIYVALPDNTIQVKLVSKYHPKGKITGKIKPVADGFAYFPTGSKLKGETMPTVKDVKKSLEEE